VYWHGVDTLGRPILWENFGAMDFRNFDSARKIRFYILLFEAVYKVMPEGVTQFTVVADSKSLPYARALTKPAFFLGMASLFVKAFPDRLGFFLAKGNSVAQALLKLMKPVLPASIKSKMLLPSNFEEELIRILPNGERDVPDWLGGTKIHPTTITKNLSAMVEDIKRQMEAGVR
jgi:hypothetical protein